MDKEEFRVKLDQINHLVEKNDYKGAMEVVDSIDWRRVKNVRTLCVVGEIYAANKRYEDSKEIFLLAYHRAPIGKNILYRLIEVSLKTGNIEEAMEYYEEYLQVAPNDSTKYILKYKIFKENNASLEDQIKILEDYKEKEFTEKWSYELAKLYYEAGEKEKCLGICNEMALWFSDGKYVMKAMELKVKLGAMTEAEKEKYQKQLEPKAAALEQPKEAKAEEEESENSEEASEESKSEEEDADQEEEADDAEESGAVIESISTKEVDVNYSESIQERISKGIRDIFNSRKRESEKTEELSDLQEEMIKDQEKEPDFGEVPALEEEEGALKASMEEVALTEEASEEIAPVEEVSEEIAPKEEKVSRFSLKIPELKIPKGIKKTGMNEALKVPEAPKIANVELVAPKAADEEPEEEVLDFNLEDTILAAASAQGIEIPGEKDELEKELEKALMESGDSEAEFTEEDTEEYFEESDEDVLEAVNDDTEEEYQGEASEEDYLEEILESVEEEFEEETKAPEITKNLETELQNFREELKKTLMESETVEEIAENPEDREYVSEPVKEEVEIELNLDEDEYETEEPEEEVLTETDPLALIPREDKLSEDELLLFSYLSRVPGMEDQIVRTLSDVQMAAADKTSKTGNIVVMGGKEMGKTRLISALIPAICKELNLEASKVAYVFADQINGKNIPKIISKLSSGFLVIEEASQLDKRTVEQLSKAMEFRTDGLTVILEDEKSNMRKLLALYPKFAQKFTSVISIPVFMNDELIMFADVYARENGYSIDQVGMNALYNVIGSYQKESEPMSVGGVKELIDAAIAKSQSGLLKFKKKRVSEDGLKILTDKDFNI